MQLIKCKTRICHITIRIHNDMLLTWNVKWLACTMWWQHSKFCELSSCAWMKAETRASDNCGVTLPSTYCPKCMVEGKKARRAGCVHCKTWTCNECFTFSTKRSRKDGRFMSCLLSLLCHYGKPPLCINIHHHVPPIGCSVTHRPATSLAAARTCGASEGSMSSFKWITWNELC